MTSGNSRVRALVLAVVLFLPAFPVRALPFDGSARVREDRGVLTVLFKGLRSFWHGLIGTAGVAMKEGVLIDPNGRLAGAGTNSDNGMLIDPHG